MLSTGGSLRDVPSGDLLNVAYRLAQRHSLMTKEEAEALEKLDSRLNDAGYEAETGMPAITQWMKPADELLRERKGIRPHG